MKDLKATTPFEFVETPFTRQTTKPVLSCTLQVCLLVIGTKMKNQTYDAECNLLNQKAKIIFY